MADMTLILHFMSYNILGEAYMNFGLNPLSAGSGLTFTRVLGSISKTIGIIRQMAPLYQDIKPLFKKAPILLDRISKIREGINNVKIPSSNYMQEVEKNVGNQTGGGPNFFQ